ncbi:copper resistance protein CopC [Neobacillus niacini]|uniref:copper resistance CopC family protein n=1 Tax=Neobacillus niacini TaxID=86668 RepID=UPI0021CB0CCA|nr:copper resistance protein CopC [Neobacillus niacini]MCM3768323.1 copper resistance protein CopC [Neobacillus niacini]
MKRLFIILAIIIVVLPTIASAHTHLESSNPESGQVVTEKLNEIVLNFGGKIESLSTMTLVKDGQDVPFKSIDPQGTQMIGTLEAPLENGSYVIQWKIIGEDSHIITGDIPFSVQVEQAVEEPTKKEPTTEESNKTKDTDSAATEEKEVKKDKANQEVLNNEQSDSNLTKIIIPIVIVLLLGISLFMLFRRKK